MMSVLISSLRTLRNPSAYGSYSIMWLLLIVVSSWYGSMTRPVQWFIDLGREAFIPWRMTEGELLIRDIPIVYGPLSYQINALILSVGFPVLPSLEIAAGIASFVSLLLLYLMASLLISRVWGRIIVAFVATFCLYRADGTNYNWFFPYAFAPLYALPLILGAMTVLIHPCLPLGHWRLPTSNFLLGLAATLKIEYIPCLLVALIFNLFFSQSPYRYRAVGIASLIAPSIISYGYLLFEGVPISLLSHYVVDILNHARSPSTLRLYGYLSPIEYLVAIPRAIYLDGIAALTLIGFPTLSLFLVVRLNQCVSRFDGRVLLINLLILIILLTTLWITQARASLVQGSSSLLWPNPSIILVVGLASTFLLNRKIFDFRAFPIALTAAVIFCIFHPFLERAHFSFIITGCWFLLFSFFSPSFRRSIDAVSHRLNISHYHFTWVYLLGIATSLRIIWNGDIFIAGSFLLPFLIAAALIIFCIWKETLQGHPESHLLSRCLGVTILILCFSILIRTERDLRRFVPIQVNTNAGRIFLGPKEADVLMKSVKLVHHFLTANERVVVWPEGEIVNLLADRPSHNHLSRLIPPYVDSLGLPRILKILKEDPPEGILLLKDSVHLVYGRGAFCDDYGREICDFTFRNYTLVSGSQDDYQLFLLNRT